MAIKHAFTSAKPDGGDATLVRPLDWNADHVGTNPHDHAGTNDGGLLTNDEHDGYELLNHIAVPLTPVADKLKLYARNRAGRMLLEMIGPAGLDSSLQPALFGNSMTLWLPGTGTTAGINFGVNWTVGATQSHPAISTAAPQPMNSIKRARWQTSTTAGNAAGIRSGAAVCWRGNAAGLGGFFFFARFGQQLNLNGGQKWIGLSASNALLTGEPSAQANSVFVGYDSTDPDTGNWFFVTRDASTANRTNLGSNMARNTTHFYDFMMFCPPNGSAITYRIVNLATGTVVADNVVTSTNLPVNTALLYVHSEVRNGAVAAANNIECARIYVETDL